MAVTPGTKCELCGAEGNKTYVCKVCGKTICGDCLASGRFIGTKKCKACTGDAITPTKTPSPQTKGETDGKRSVIMAPFSKLGDAAKAVGHIGKSAVKETAGAVGAVGSAATGAVGAVGSVATGAVGEAASIAGAGIGKVGQFTRLVGSFDSNEGGGLLDMNDPTLKFGWDLYALLNVTIIEASGLKAADSNIVGKATSSDPYCVVKLMSDNISRRSPICKKTLSPVWNHECSTMVVNVPCQTMKIQMYDWDAASDDDLIGEALLDLTHLAPSTKTTGWLPLQLDGEPAGAVHLSLEIKFTPWSEKIAFVQEEMVAKPKPKPKFDINALYGPAMWLADALWFHWLQPIVMEHVLPILMWESWLKSLLALLIYIVASYYAVYWPALACWITAAAMMRNKTLKGYERFMANKSMTSTLDKSGKPILLEVEEANTDDVEQQEFGGLIRTFTRMSPGWVKQMAAQFQPTLKTIVDVVALARMIILWRHELSKKVFLGLLGAGVVLCFLPFWVLVMAAGVGILLANSPLKGLFIGLAKYAARPRPTGDIGLLDSMEEHHHSSDYNKLIVQKRRSKTKETVSSETPLTTGRSSSPPLQ